MRRICALFSFFPLLLVASGCTTVPITGRSQLNLLTDSELLSHANTAYSQFMKVAHSKGAVLHPSESEEAAKVISFVNRVSDNVIDASGLRHRHHWEVVVIKSTVPQAMVMPNGKIIVFTGILPIAENEAGLAAIIGHEVAHVAARHGAERVSQALLAQATLSAVDASLAARQNRYRPVISTALGLGVQFGILLPYSREHELEADRIGQIYMAKAGYDPAQAIAFWERSAARSTSSKRPEFASTHPSDTTRLDELRQALPEARLFYAERGRPLPTNQAEFQKLAQEAATRGSVAAAPVAGKPSETIAALRAAPELTQRRFGQQMNRKVELEPPPPPPTGKFAFEAERVAQADQCQPSSVAVLTDSGPGFENYSVPCSRGHFLPVRCEFGNCRVEK